MKTFILKKKIVFWTRDERYKKKNMSAWDFIGGKREVIAKDEEVEGFYMEGGGGVFWRLEFSRGERRKGYANCEKFQAR